MTFDGEGPISGPSDCYVDHSGAGTRGLAPRLHLVGDALADHYLHSDAIGRAAAALCPAFDSIIMFGSSPTLSAMCRHLAGKKVHVLANAIRTIKALSLASGPQVSVPGGMLLDDEIIHGLTGEPPCGAGTASKLFISATGIGQCGVTHTGVWTSGAARSLGRSARRVVVLAEGAAFERASGDVSFELDEIDVVVTDHGISQGAVDLLKRWDIEILIAGADGCEAL